jgi:hypothetical protein
MRHVINVGDPVKVGLMQIHGKQALTIDLIRLNLGSLIGVTIDLGLLVVEISLNKVSQFD